MEILIVEVHSCEWIESVGIEPGGEEEKLRFKVFDGGLDGRIEGIDVEVDAGAGRERDIEGGVFAVADTDFVLFTGVRVQGQLMNAAEEDGGAFVKDVLGSVAVVDIPVEDADPFDAVCLLGVVGRNGDIIEEAKAHRFFGTGVVTGRAHEIEGALESPLEDGINTGNGSACGEGSGAIGIGADEGFSEVDGVATGQAGLFNEGPVFRTVDGLDPFGGSRLRSLPVEAILEFLLAKGVLNALHPFRSLGVAIAGIVVQAIRVVKKGNRQHSAR